MGKGNRYKTEGCSHSNHIGNKTARDNVGRFRAALVKLDRWLAEDGATCEIAIKTPDMEEFAGYDVWRAWRGDAQLR